MTIESLRTGLLWKPKRGCQPIAEGLRQAVFSGGWLADAELDVGDRHE